VRLRSITLAGFKTFARQTEITFDSGVTAIVGPNGSGKSNIVDAFKWVLGERNAKEVRGRKMEEVIYSGGRRRAKANDAEVIVVIDNTEHRIAVDYDEVAIRRRVDRTGGSDYFLNGSRVRRHDLMDVLASTGLTTDSYAIVDQRDIDNIISCTPDQRRRLIEEAAQVRGVKAKRTEATAKLEDLAGNLTRLEDLRTEIQPRLEAVRAQAEVAREADQARRRLELLRGSIAWEEWREARDAHKRATAQLVALEKRLAEARIAAEGAENAYQHCRLELQAAQDRRLQRQQAIAGRRLELSKAEGDLALAEERGRSQAAMAEAARTEQAELAARLEAASRLRSEMAGQLAEAEAELARVPEPPPRPPAGDVRRAREAAQTADRARKAVQSAEANLASIRGRLRFQEESLARLERQVLPAESQLPDAEEAAAAAAARAREASEAASRLARLRAELEGLQSLWPRPRGHELRRVGDVILAEPGFEAPVSAALGPLIDAWVAPDEAAARTAATSGEQQTTVLYPAGYPAVDTGSLAEHVRCEPGFESLGRRLLGRVVVGRDIDQDGVYHEPGLVRAGSDPRVALAARRRRLGDEIAQVEPVAAESNRRGEESRRAQGRVSELRALAGQRRQLDEVARQLASTRDAEARESSRAPELQRAAASAEATAAELRRAVDDHEKLLAEHRAEVHRLELERARWRERASDLRRQAQAAENDVAALERSRESRLRRAAQAEQQAADVSSALPGLRERVAEARAALEAAERDSPDEEAELAQTARRLVTAEEARVDARLKVSTMEGGLGLHRREAELAEARMSELRGRMPAGMAPEEVPGGKAREREMRHLERRLQEIGPVNELAEQECAELEERYRTLMTQLDDIAAARADLETLIARLREEEETRYEAVFGAVAANFQEFFNELTAGGRATLRHAEGADGPRSGVEILVQPPRKRMQNISLLSSGERALTALALVVALQEINPAPFTILDEVDAALDDANVGRYGELLTRLGRERQFMVITHNHLTMASAASLYGVHLDESGSSHLVSVRLEDVQAKEKAASEAAQSA
jgi:chromosome segregation protein